MGRDQLCGVAFEMIRRSVQLLFALRYDRFGASAVAVATAQSDKPDYHVERNAPRGHRSTWGSLI